jgi:hypothetical protein
VHPNVVRRVRLIVKNVYNVFGFYYKTRIQNRSLHYYQLTFELFCFSRRFFSFGIAIGQLSCINIFTITRTTILGFEKVAGRDRYQQKTKHCNN